MTRRVIFRPETEEDVQQAIDWYEQRRSGLGREFLGCLEAVLAQLARQPGTGVVAHREVRRQLLRRFPYSVLFVEIPAMVVVIAVFHQRRDPSVIAQRTTELSSAL